MSAPVTIEALSLEEKVGQLFMLAFEGETPRDAAPLLRDYLVGSVYLSQDNLRSVDGAVSLLTALQQAAAATPHALPILAACDQEGAWAVLTPHATRGPGNLALGAAGAAHVEQLYAVFGCELRALGIAADLAPEETLLLVTAVAAEEAATLRLRGIGPNLAEEPFVTFVREVRRRHPGVALLRFQDAASLSTALEGVGHVIAVTENYPLPGFDVPQEAQHRAIASLLAAGANPIVVGLRDPYDLPDLAGVGTYITALGYAPVCAQAAVEVLFGERPGARTGETVACLTGRAMLQ